LVSHDRAFLDNVVTQTIAAEGGGTWREYVGGYEDWLRQRPAPAAEPAPAPVASATESRRRPRQRQKLSYHEQRELAALPGRIEALEAEQAALHGKMTAPDYFWNPPEVLRDDQQHHDEIEASLMELLERWEALEARQAGGCGQGEAVAPKRSAAGRTVCPRAPPDQSSSAKRATGRAGSFFTSRRAKLDSTLATPSRPRRNSCRKRLYAPMPGTATLSW